MTTATAPRRRRRAEPTPDAIRTAETRRNYSAVAAGIFAAVVVIEYSVVFAVLAIVLAAAGHRPRHWSGHLAVAVAIIVTFYSARAMT